MSHIVLSDVVVFQEKSVAKDQGILGKLECAITSLLSAELFSFECFLVRNLVRDFSFPKGMSISQNWLFATFAPK